MVRGVVLRAFETQRVLRPFKRGYTYRFREVQPCESLAGFDIDDAVMDGNRSIAMNLIMQHDPGTQN